MLSREGTDRNLDKSTSHFNLLTRSRRREESPNSNKSGMRPRNGAVRTRRRQQRKRQRTAALQDLAEVVAGKSSRQRLGVRQSYAALISVRWHAQNSRKSPHGLCALAVVFSLSPSDGQRVGVRGSWGSLG